MQLFQRRQTMHPLDATPEDVRHAYRLLLGREPDPEGMETHWRLAREQNLSADALAELFLASDEFRSKQSDYEVVRVAFPGYTLFVSAVDPEISRTIRTGHAYEPYVESALRELLVPGATFVDVGANIGYFTALGAHLVGPSGRVVAWEPVDRNVQLIYATAWENGFENVTVFPFAAASESKLVAMAAQGLSSNAGVIDRGMGQLRTKIVAQAQRLDDCLSGLERLDVIKFDVEGYELHAWRGAERLIAKHKPNVLTEFHPKCLRENGCVDPAEYLKALLDYSSCVEVLHRVRPRVACADVESVIREWRIAGDDLGMGDLMHLDLRARSPNGGGRVRLIGDS